MSKYNQGFYRISNEEYHSDKSILSSSGIKYLLQSPAHFKVYAESGNKETTALSFGTAFHTAVFEADRFNEAVVTMPKIDRRTKVGKAAYAEFMDSVAGKTIISEAEIETIKCMKDSIFNHPEASKIIEYEDGVAELSGFWKDERGFMCKVRPDWLPGHGLCVDLKSTENASELAFSKSCANYGYHNQSYFYLKGLNILTGEKHDTFVFIAAEKTPPYGVAVYYASSEMIEKGKENVEKALDIYAECLETDIWPCYPENPIELNLPRWAA